MFVNSKSFNDQYKLTPSIVGLVDSSGHWTTIMRLMCLSLTDPSEILWLLHALSSSLGIQKPMTDIIHLQLALSLSLCVWNN